ncbi:Protein of unknown function, partial [Gryllus bimaculatus]
MNASRDFGRILRNAFLCDLRPTPSTGRHQNCPPACAVMYAKRVVKPKVVVRRAARRGRAPAVAFRATPPRSAPRSLGSSLSSPSTSSPPALSCPATPSPRCPPPPTTLPPSLLSPARASRLCRIRRALPRAPTRALAVPAAPSAPAPAPALVHAPARESDSGGAGRGGGGGSGGAASFVARVTRACKRMIMKFDSVYPKEKPSTIFGPKHTKC